MVRNVIVGALAVVGLIALLFICFIFFAVFETKKTLDNDAIVFANQTIAQSVRNWNEKDLIPSLNMQYAVGWTINAKREMDAFYNNRSQTARDVTALFSQGRDKLGNLLYQPKTFCNNFSKMAPSGSALPLQETATPESIAGSNCISKAQFEKGYAKIALNLTHVSSQPLQYKINVLLIEYPVNPRP